MRKQATLLLFAFASTALWAQKTFDLTLDNESKMNVSQHPVSLQLKDYDIDTHSALVTNEGREIPCQLDDLDGDGKYDELFFLKMDLFRC